MVVSVWNQEIMVHSYHWHIKYYGIRIYAIYIKNKYYKVDDRISYKETTSHFGASKIYVITLDKYNFHMKQQFNH